MRKTTKKLLVRRLTFAAAVIIINILQNTRGFFPEIFGARAFLLIPLVVCIGMFERSYAGALLGLFAGALWDMSMPDGNGYNALILMIFAAACGLMITVLMRNHLLTALILSASACVIYVLLYALFFVVAAGIDDAGRLLLSFYLPCAVYTLAFTPVFYLATRRIMRITAVEEEF